VLAILALARSLGLGVVAEGVETEGQREFLLANGCGALQGYLLCQPLAADDVPGFVARQERKADG
jgi:EAL domain-containing protein (putative c-di-GMP-specific phosphodiesterase class I)